MSHIHGEISAWLTYPGSRLLDFLSLDNLVTLNILDFGHLPNSFENTLRERASVALDMAIVNVTDPAIIAEVRILGMGHVDEVEMVI
jgi:hypothetical protein